MQSQLEVALLLVRLSTFYHSFSRPIHHQLSIPFAIPYAMLELILTHSGNDLGMGFHLRLLPNTMDPRRHSS